MTEDPLRDTETGLFTGPYFRATIDTRIAAARRLLRPASVVIIALAPPEPVRSAAADARRALADAIRATVRESDIACRLEDGRFALILEDTPEEGAIWTVRRVRQAMPPQPPVPALWAGVCCYPAHALTADDVVAGAETALELAREWPQDRTEVAPTGP